MIGGFFNAVKKGLAVFRWFGAAGALGLFAGRLVAFGGFFIEFGFATAAAFVAFFFRGVFAHGVSPACDVMPCIVAKARTGYNSPMESMLTAYHAALSAGKIKPDAMQQAAVGRMDALARTLARSPDRRRPHGWQRLRQLLTPARKRQAAAPCGFYLYGGVGRGKTMLMDLFYQHVAISPKRRVHFHAFMLEVHDHLHALRRAREDKGRDTMAMDDALMKVADHIAHHARLLCFDEFQVRDVADAMILGRLFTALFDRGVAVVMTSNIPPDELYKDGLQRDRFVPFIELLKHRLEVMRFDGETDYRLARLMGRKVYFTPHDDDAQQQLERIFGDMADGAAGAPAVIDLKGRQLHIPRAAHGVAMFDFDDICAINASAADYLALARDYSFVIVSDIPKLDDSKRDLTLRLVMLIDALYDQHRHIALSAAAQPDYLYKGEALQVAFDRTVSRLMEMQSQGYRNSEHGMVA